MSDSYGDKYPYSVLISGDLAKARSVLVKGMSWSDHPGRGFEALRQALIADSSRRLVVVGVSFPGAGLNSPRMTKVQKESLQGPAGDFSVIGAQQWQAITHALKNELSEIRRLTGLERKIQDYEFILSGSSQGASNAVGLLQSLPEDITIASIGLAEETDLSTKGKFNFWRDYLQHGGNHFNEYTEVNPYNEFEALGPSHNPFINALKRPASHATAVVDAMSRGGAIDRIIYSLQDMGLRGIDIHFRMGSEDKVSSRLDVLQNTEKFRHLGNIASTNIVIRHGHYHPYLENLANARYEFQSFIP